MLKLALVVLWPSFMVAIIAEGFFFSLFDPTDLLLVGGHVDLNPMAAYTLGFLFFWTFCSLAAMLSCYLIRTEEGQLPF